MKEDKAYIKAMQQWAKSVALWQLENPEKDWATELFGATTAGADGGGSNPPPPPPPKPPGS